MCTREILLNSSFINGERKNLHKVNNGSGVMADYECHATTS